MKDVLIYTPESELGILVQFPVLEEDAWLVYYRGQHVSPEIVNDMSIAVSL